MYAVRKVVSVIACSLFADSDFGAATHKTSPKESSDMGVVGWLGGIYEDRDQTLAISKSIYRILLMLCTYIPYCELSLPLLLLFQRYLSSTTCFRHFSAWLGDGVMRKILEALAQDFEERGGIDLAECFIEDTFIMAEKGGLHGDVLRFVVMPAAHAADCNSPYGSTIPTLGRGLYLASMF